MDQKKRKHRKVRRIARDFKLGTYICPGDRGSISDQELSDHQRRCTDRSMENTIMPGDRLIGNRLAFLKDTPERGDVVIFHYPDDEEELYVKRVIGLPGEEVRIDDGKIYIDGSETPLEEDYLKEEWTVATGPYLFEVPDDCYLVLGITGMTPGTRVTGITNM